MHIEDIFYLMAVAGIIGGLYICFRPNPRKQSQKDPPPPPPEPEVIEAETSLTIDETEDGQDPSDSAPLSETEAKMIDADDDLKTVIKKNRKELLELSYTLAERPPRKRKAKKPEEGTDRKGEEAEGAKPAETPAPPAEERKEDAVSVAEENGRTYFTAPDCGSPEPEFYHRH